jgi:hypothetical protein
MDECLQLGSLLRKSPTGVSLGAKAFVHGICLPPRTLKDAKMTKRGNLEWITESIIGVAIEVRRALGPGLLGGLVSFSTTPPESPPMKPA